MLSRAKYRQNLTVHGVCLRDSLHLSFNMILAMPVSLLRLLQGQQDTMTWAPQLELPCPWYYALALSRTRNYLSLSYFQGLYGHQANES